MSLFLPTLWWSFSEYRIVSCQLTLPQHCLKECIVADKKLSVNLIFYFDGNNSPLSIFLNIFFLARFEVSLWYVSLPLVSQYSSTQNDPSKMQDGCIMILLKILLCPSPQYPQNKTQAFLGGHAGSFQSLQPNLSIPDLTPYPPDM